MDKEQLKAQLKAQSEPKKPSVTVNDARNHGLKRVYFFQRKVDGFIFPLDNELQASHLFRRKDFNDKFTYIGWSSGQKLREFEGGHRVDIEYSSEEALTESSQQQLTSYKEAYDKALEEELMDAVDNPDKSRPRDFRRRDLNGNFLDNTVLNTVLGM